MCGDAKFCVSTTSKLSQAFLIKRIEGENVVTTDSDNQQSLFVGEFGDLSFIVDGGDGSDNPFVGQLGEKPPEQAHLMQEPVPAPKSGHEKYYW